MKKLYYSLLIVFFLFACKKEEIPTYYDLTDDRYIYFGSSGGINVDTIEISFFEYPGQSEIYFPLKFISTGVGEKEAKINLVSTSETTAPEFTYELLQRTYFKPNQQRDTIDIKLIYNKILDNEKFKIVLELEESEDFLLGLVDKRKFTLWFHNILMQPAWWDDIVFAGNYMGAYSDKKYLLYLEIVGVPLDENVLSISEIRHYVLLFKQYLNEQKANGTPVLEEDGSEMTVSLMGNNI